MPMPMRSGSEIPLAAASAETDTPLRAAMPESVSPAATVTEAVTGVGWSTIAARARNSPAMRGVRARMGP